MRIGGALRSGARLARTLAFALVARARSREPCPQAEQLRRLGRMHKRPHVAATVVSLADG